MLIWIPVNQPGCIYPAWVYIPVNQPWCTYPSVSLFLYLQVHSDAFFTANHEYLPVLSSTVYLPIDIQENKHTCSVLFVLPANRKDLPVDSPVGQ